MVRKRLVARLSRKLDGSKAREIAEIVDEVRLVVIAALHGDVRPVRFGVPAQQAAGVLKTSNPLVRLGRKADLRLEELDEPAVAGADGTRDAANAGARPALWTSDPATSAPIRESAPLPCLPRKATHADR